MSFPDSWADLRERDMLSEAEAGSRRDSLHRTGLNPEIYSMGGIRKCSVCGGNVAGNQRCCEPADDHDTRAAKFIQEHFPEGAPLESWMKYDHQKARNALAVQFRKVERSAQNMISDELFDALYESAVPTNGGDVVIRIPDVYAESVLWDRDRFRAALMWLIKHKPEDSE